ncbi:hypothetical protein AALB53_18825 [Lachnospiraceae bacterium 47-T17]
MKKCISIFLSVVMIISMSISAFANTAENKDVFCIDNYTQYTIDFSETTSKIRSAETGSIDDAISYVKSLELGDTEYSYIEEACLNELYGYKEDDVVLESYTVLVPKTRARQYYGTYAGHDFYYEYTSVANMRRDTIGEKKSAANESRWKQWVLGTMDLAMCWRTRTWSIPYTIVRIATGISDPAVIHYGSYNQHVEQFTNTVTRSIFRKGSSKAGYQDQTSSLKVSSYICPVGVTSGSDFIYYGDTYNGVIQANDLSKNSILQLANTYSNHGSQVFYSVTSYRVTENWNK